MEIFVQQLSKVVLLDVLCIYIEETNLNHNDASIKTDTCKVPENVWGQTDIYRRSVVQALPIEYPSGNTNAGLYNFTAIGASGFYSGDGIFNVTGSIIYITADGSIYGEDNIYKDSDNPIICKYWYFEYRW